MADQPADDLCPRESRIKPSPSHPHSPPIYLTSVWSCQDPAQADALLGGDLDGYVYQRINHPNADLLSEKCRLLHRAEQACVVSSGMSAIALALISQCRAGDRIAISNQLYGTSFALLNSEAPRLGIECEVFDPLQPDDVQRALERQPRMVVVESIGNPMLSVIDLATLAERCHSHDAILMVDNTFATPVLCQPLTLGADLVMESVSKSMNGHSDVMLGMLAGSERLWERVPTVVGTWGFTAAPMDCWLAQRGLATLAVRMSRVCENAMRVAHWLAEHPDVVEVRYPGLADHPDHQIAARQFSGGFGSMVTFELSGSDERGARFIENLTRIPFCPSLGEVATTVSHPVSTSHRGFSVAERRQIGISPNTIRLSVGIETADSILQWLAEGM